jgi:large subunit ribosomal protein L15
MRHRLCLPLLHLLNLLKVSRFHLLCLLQVLLELKVSLTKFQMCSRFVKSAIALGRLAGIDEKGITPDVLRKAGVVNSKNALVKVLGNGDLSKAVTVHAHKFSKSAQEKIEKAGGKVQVL